MPGIDWVIAWVDGDDDAHEAARRSFAPNDSDVHPEAKATDRFSDNGELYYNIASVLQYAGFVRKIFIVTDRQRPKFIDDFSASGLCEGSRIEIVDHDKIFGNLPVARPNFNSLAIESFLWRIPGLSERFIYSNDDFFLNQRMPHGQFYRGKMPVLHGDWVNADHLRMKIILRRLIRKITGRRNIRPSFRIAQEKAAAMVGFSDRFLHVHHHPHPLRRSTFESYFHENPDVLEWQGQFRFRDVRQFLPVALANHIEIATHGVVPKKAKPATYLSYQKPLRTPAFLESLHGERHLFGCVQSLDLFPDREFGLIRKALNRKFRATLPDSVVDALGGL